MLLWVWRAPSTYVFLLGIVGPSLKGFMLAIDIASTYGPMDFFDVHWINDPWWILLQGLPACDNWSLLCWSSQESPVFIIKNYPYGTYHDYDITLVTLGSVLTCISMGKRSCFHGQGKLFQIWIFCFSLSPGLLLEEPSLQKGLDHMDLDRKDR